MIAELKPYPNMKDSDVPWLGEVPKNWEVVRGRQLFEIKKRIVGELGYPIISVTQAGLRIKDVETGEGQMSQDYSKYQIVKVGDFAMNSMDLLTGGVGIASSPGATSPDYRVFSIRDKFRCHDRFMLHVFRMLYQNRGFYAWGQGSAQLGRWRLPRKRFNDFLFPVPPPSDQAAIVRFLDYADRRIQRYILTKQKLIKLLEEQKRAIIHQAVIRGLDPDVPLKDSGVEWLGVVPEHWRLVRLKNATRLIMGQSPPSDNCSHERIGVAFLQGCAEFGPVHPRPVQYCSAPPKLSPLNAILMSVRAPVGRLNFADQEYGIGRGLCAIIPNEELFAPIFARYALEVIGHGFAISSTGSTYDAVSIGDVGIQPTILPPLPEQATIVQHLNEATADIGTAVNRAQLEIGLLKEYRTRLITDLITGKLDARETTARLQDENEEPESLDDSEILAEGEEDGESVDLELAQEETET